MRTWPRSPRSEMESDLRPDGPTPAGPRCSICSAVSVGFLITVGPVIWLCGRSGETQRATSHSSPIWWRLPSHRPSPGCRSASTLLSRSHGSCPTAGWNGCGADIGFTRQPLIADRRRSTVGRGGPRVRHHILARRGEKPYRLVRRCRAVAGHSRFNQRGNACSDGSGVP
jgi:hypothetical protein